MGVRAWPASATSALKATSASVSHTLLLLQYCHVAIDTRASPSVRSPRPPTAMLSLTSAATRLQADHARQSGIITLTRRKGRWADRGVRRTPDPRLSCFVSCPLCNNNLQALAVPQIARSAPRRPDRQVQPPTYMHIQSCSEGSCPVCHVPHASRQRRPDVSVMCWLTRSLCGVAASKLVGRALAF